jgi:hypothetical protein
MNQSKDRRYKSFSTIVIYFYLRIKAGLETNTNVVSIIDFKKRIRFKVFYNLFEFTVRFFVSSSNVFLIHIIVGQLFSKFAKC